MEDRQRQYWLHRITGGDNALPYALQLLMDENLLSIGWSDFSENAFASDVQKRGIEAINERYEKEGWKLSRNRRSLLRFIKGMRQGDYVVVPRPGIFSVYEIADDVILTNESYSDIRFRDDQDNVPVKKGKYLYNAQGDVIDLGFYRRVIPISINLSRNEYAEVALRSRMKVLHTNADISDLWSEVENVIDKYKKQKSNQVKEEIKPISKPGSLQKIVNLCETLRNFLDALKITQEEMGTIAIQIYEMFSPDEEGVIQLQQVGLEEMRFLDTYLQGVSGFVSGDNMVHVDIAEGSLLGLFIKNITDKNVGLSPLYENKDLIKQCRSIDFKEWYLNEKVLSQGDETYTRSDIIDRIIVQTPNYEKEKVFSIYDLKKSGVYYFGEELPFADDPVEVAYKEILYEIAESFRIEGILHISTVEELEQHIEKNHALFINSLSIKNYMLFSAAKQIDFHDRFSVIIGNNATGKTTALSALRLILESMLPITKNESNENSSYGYVGSISLKDVNREITPTSGVKYNFPVTIEAYFSEFGKVSRARMEEVRKTQTKNRILDNYFRQVDKDVTNNMRLPLISYCGVERTISMETKKSRNKLHNNRYDGYNSCLETHCSSAYLRSWLNDLQKRAKQSYRVNEILKSFRDAVCSCFYEERIVNIEYKYLESQSANGKKDIIDDIVITQEDLKGNQSRLLLRSMSAGYRTMIGLIADLAFRCISLNPHLGKDAIVGTSGLVLIDEIDMHLHPSWQRHIVNDLMRCFPKLQFIVTTHSPFIVQSLKQEQIINLAGEGPMLSPQDENLATNALYMGVDSDRSINFKNMEDEAYDFLVAVNKENVSINEIDEMIKAYSLRYSDNPAYVAKLRIEAGKAKDEKLYKSLGKVIHETNS